MRVLYGQRPVYPDMNWEIVQKSGNANVQVGDRVMVAEGTLFKNDVDTPWRSLLRP